MSAPSFTGRRRTLPGVLVVALLAAALVALPRSARTAPPPAQSDGALASVADSLLARHISGPGGGWAWRSAIQAPHLQTDRDVGAAGIAVALLAAYDTTGERRYLDGARRSGDWLLAVARRSPGGLRWPDFDDPADAPSGTHFTSFDDGAPGIADALWRLGDATGDPRYRRAAVVGMRSLEAQAQDAGGDSCPRVCRWRYYDDATDYRSGMGEGAAGIAYAFDVFAERTGDPRFERLALGTARYLESQITPAGAMPERGGSKVYDTGFLSGAAGDAFMFLRLYTHTHDPRWLHDAERLLGWVRHRAEPKGNGLAWPIAIAPDTGDDTDLATGMEEGAAGIGWVFLQAHSVTHDPSYLQTAVGAASWLQATALHEGDGVAWPEDHGKQVVHTSLNNGTPGVAWFMHDLALATGDQSYEDTAVAGRHWLLDVARQDARGVYWNEYRNARVWRLPREPSWHWGTAGIVAFLARMDGWGVDMPGEEPALTGAAG
jgi:uncharacterized protein YyaL (SSP411 family)